LTYETRAKVGPMSRHVEHWVEVNLDVDLDTQDEVLLDVLRPYARKLKRLGELHSYHFFREPEIRFRFRLASAKSKTKCERELAKMAEALVKKGRASGWHFGNHGEEGKPYFGEEDRYGRQGWKVAQDYFNQGSEVALRLLELRRGARLENPLWGRGLGNPWEGGERNPWREVSGDALAYHWSRYVHLFSNQLGYDMEAEAVLCARQAEGYKRVSREVGLMW
jgi:Lantibiotic biosynthesis dehydratase C-term